MSYLFYLEPYTFLLCRNNKTVVYNTLNAAYILCPEHPTVQSIIDQWKEATNGYCTLLGEQILSDETVKCFVEAVKDSFSGDCVEYDKDRPKPYIFQPNLFLNTDIRIKEEKKKTSLGNHIMENLHEVSLFLPSICKLGCAACASYYRQMNHCTVHSSGILSIKDYFRLARQLKISGIKRINLLAGGDPIENSCLSLLLPAFEQADMKVHLYLTYPYLCNEYREFSQQTKCMLEVMAHPEEFTTKLVKDMQEYPRDIVQWSLIVSQEKDMELLDKLELPTEAVVRIKPFYTDCNLDFFKEYVYTDLEDILAVPIDKKTIFRHKVLNDNFFGKLFIFPSGEVYANVNNVALGNILDESLKELIYKELTERDIWLRVRSNETPCKQCINKDLCPSISNYELVIGRGNLCNIDPY